MQFQFILVGIVRESLVYNKVLSDEFRLLDVIETINDTNCGKIFPPGTDIQERFEAYLESKQSIRLSLNRPFSLPSISGPLGCGKWHVKILIPVDQHSTFQMLNCENQSWETVDESTCSQIDLSFLVVQQRKNVANTLLWSQ